jgi:exonuclease III
LSARRDAHGPPELQKPLALPYMRICCWNVRRASDGSSAWDLFDEISPDLALLQEVIAVPKTVGDQYQTVMIHAAGNVNPQRFSTAILVRGTVGAPVPLSSRWDWVNHELERFKGNLLAHRISVLGREYRVLSAYCPAWPVDPERLRGIDVEPVKLKLNPKVWVTELLWAALLDSCNSDGPPWVVGGDLNSSETFDYMWPGGPRGNREILDRMQNLGLVECLRHSSGALVPTFRNARDGRVVHQMDHLFVSGSLVARLVSCGTAEHARVFEASLSDHLPIVADFSELDSVAF